MEKAEYEEKIKELEEKLEQKQEIITEYEKNRLL